MLQKNYIKQTWRIINNKLNTKNVMDSAELINNELKSLNRWLKSNKIGKNADKTK